MGKCACGCGFISGMPAGGWPYIPTIIHGWTDPEEESWQAYLLGAVGEGLVLCAALFQHASLVGILYPLYAATFGFAMVGIVLFSRWWYGAGEDGVLETY